MVFGIRHRSIYLPPQPRGHKSIWRIVKKDSATHTSNTHTTSIRRQSSYTVEVKGAHLKINHRLLTTIMYIYEQKKCCKF